MNKFHTATYQANLLYGIEIPPEDAEELGLIAYNFIGNKRYKLYRYYTEVNCKDNSVDLPCNCKEIEAFSAAMTASETSCTLPAAKSAEAFPASSCSLFTSPSAFEKISPNDLPFDSVPPTYFTVRAVIGLMDDDEPIASIAMYYSPPIFQYLMLSAPCFSPQ